MLSNSILNSKEDVRLESYAKSKSPAANPASYSKSVDDVSVKYLTKELSSNYRHRRLQFMVYNFLEKPRKRIAIVYHFFVFLLIVASLVISIISTIEEYEKHDVVVWVSYSLEICLVAIFGLEYILRIWSCSAHGTYRGFWGKLRFLRKPYMIIDIIVIIATAIILIYDRGTGFVNLSIFRFLRFLQVLRILRLDRQRGAFKIVSQIFYDHRQELMTVWYMSFIILITCSFLVYLAERASPNPADESQMRDLADGLYWGIISLLTIGYGDISPRTWTGKFITCIFSLVGTAFFALPAGIIGSGFALQVAQHQRQKHFNKKRIPAAAVIQAYWKLYASHPSCDYRATWTSCRISRNRKKYHTRDFLDAGIMDSPATSRRATPSFPKRRFDTSFSGQTGKSMMPALHQGTVAATIPLATHIRNRCVSVGNLIMDPGSVEDHQATVLSLPSALISNDDVMARLNGKLNGEAVKELSTAEKNVIRFLRKIKLGVSLRKFKEARRPYDVKDVIEQYTAGQIETFGYIKKLQSRIEIGLGFKDKHDVEIARHNILGRLNSIETKVDMIESKMNLIISMIQASNATIAVKEENEKIREKENLKKIADEKLPNQRFHVTSIDGNTDDRGQEAERGAA